MRFFNTKVLTKEHVLALKKNLKFYTTQKYINYNNNFIDVVDMEKGIYVTDRENELFSMIEEYLEPWLDDWKVIEMQLESGTWLEYDYNKLPKKLKDYMYKIDSLCFELWYRDVNGKGVDYERRLNKLEELIPDYTDDEFNRYVLLGHAIPTTLGKKARDSARRSYKTVNEIIKCNIDTFESFLTLTFADVGKKYRHLQLNDEREEGEEEIRFDYVDGTDFELVKRIFTNFMKNLKRKLDKKGYPLEYITVWELQGNGNYHFHILSTRIPDDELFDIPTWLDYDYIKKERFNGKGLKNWVYGKSDCQKIKNKARLTTYVSKYIIKSFQNVQEGTYLDYLNKKKYFVTKGLKRPIESYDFLNENLELNDPYTKEYINPYNKGLITKKQYTIIC